MLLRNLIRRLDSDNAWNNSKYTFASTVWKMVMSLISHFFILIIKVTASAVYHFLGTERNSLKKHY